MANVKVLLINTLVHGSPGEQVTAFGHVFTIQPNGEAHAFVHEDFVKDEVKAGRYRVVEDKKSYPSAKKDILSDLDLGFEITNFYGTKDINALAKKISKMNQNQIKLFAETRMELNFPDSLTKDDMIEQMTKIVKEATTPAKKVSKKDTLDELNKLEKDLKDR